MIWQMPNPPLWAWVLSTALGFFLHGGAHTVVSSIGSVALFVWAALEVGWGESLFRRLLGAGVVASLLMRYL